jgi:hypothetical protein
MFPQSGAGAGDALGEAAVVATQRAVDFVEHAVRAATGAMALPAAGVATQHGRIATPVEQDQRLFAPLRSLGHGGDQGRCEHRAFGLL